VWLPVTCWCIEKLYKDMATVNTVQLQFNLQFNGLILFKFCSFYLRWNQLVERKRVDAGFNIVQLCKSELTIDSQLNYNCHSIWVVFGFVFIFSNWTNVAMMRVYIAASRCLRRPYRKARRGKMTCTVHVSDV